MSANSEEWRSEIEQHLADEAAGGYSTVDGWLAALLAENRRIAVDNARLVRMAEQETANRTEAVTWWQERVRALEVERAALELVAIAADEHLYDSTGASTYPPITLCRPLQRSEEALRDALLALSESARDRIFLRFGRGHV